jgi:hypothetical protein
MAIFYSNIADAQNDNAASFGSASAVPALISGDLKFARATHTVAAEAATDFIYVCKLPLGSRVLPHLCNIVCAAPGDAYTINVGDLHDPDRYGSAIDIKAGGSFALDELVTGPIADYKVGDNAADPGWIVIDPTAITNPTAGAKIVVTIAYV